MNSEKQNNILEVRNIYASYGEATVLFDINLEVKAGTKATAILGRNGAGKTTLMKTIAGLLKPSKGKIYFMNEDITNLPVWERVKKGLKYVPPDKRIFPSLTVYENLLVATYNALQTRNQQIINQEIEKIFEIFPRLRKLKESRGINLSGGERQMLNIGMSLIGSPKFLILDEPTEGLSPAVIKILSEVINKVKMFIPIMIIEQNLPLVKEICDSLYLMKEGKIIYHTNDIHEIRSGAYIELL